MSVNTWVGTWRERRRIATRPFLLGELFVVFLLLEVYDYVKSLESVRMNASLHNAQDVVAIEQTLHIDIEHGANQWLAQHDTLSTLLVWWYQYSHISGTMAVLTCCYLWFPQMYRAGRNALVLTNVVGMLVFVLVPVMPPRLLPHAGFVDSVAQAGFGTSHGGPVEPAQFAAMPSLHLAWATWVGVMAFAMLRGRTNKAALVFIYPLLTTAAVVSTGNHYVLDVVAGVALALATCTVFGVMTHVRRARRVPEPVAIPAVTDHPPLVTDHPSLVTDPPSLVAERSTGSD